MSNKPNIILLTIDCWRADQFGANGYAGSPTPNLDLLASQSIVYRQAITCGGWTRPSFTALLSSTYPSMYGGPLGKYSPSRPSLADSLRDGGYETAGFTTNPQIGRLHGFDRGFDTFVECEPDGALAGPRWGRIKGAQRLLCRPLTHQIFKPFGFNTLPPEVTTPAEQLVDRIAGWMSKNHLAPTFIWGHFMDAHWPYHVLRHSYTADETAAIWQDLQLAHNITLKQGYLNPGEPHARRMRNLYRKALTYVDAHIGRLIEFMQESGLLDTTILIVTSDHGEEFYEHGRWSHYQLYDENIRVPLLVRLPELEEREKVEQQVSLIDLAPTILGLAGIQKPPAMLGASLPLTDKERAVEEPVAYTEAMWADTYRLAIRDERFKFIYDEQKLDEPQLYDLLSDPNEERNIYADRPSIARSFEQKRQRHMEMGQSTSGVAAQQVEMDQTLVERLQALGYLE